MRRRESKRSSLRPFLHNPLGDGADRGPGDLERLDDGALGQTLRQERDKVFQRPGKRTAMARPRNLLCDDPLATATAQATDLTFYEDLNSTDCQMPPPVLWCDEIDPSPALDSAGR